MRMRRFVREVAARANMEPAETLHITKAMAVVIADALANGQEIELPGFGVFTICLSQPREVVNLRTHESVELSPIRRPAFMPDAALITRINSTPPPSSPPTTDHDKSAAPPIAHSA